MCACLSRVLFDRMMTVGFAIINSSSYGLFRDWFGFIQMDRERCASFAFDIVTIVNMGSVFQPFFNENRSRKTLDLFLLQQRNKLRSNREESEPREYNQSKHTHNVMTISKKKSRGGNDVGIFDNQIFACL